MSEQCKTCKEIERIESVRYRCKWNRCFVDPNDVCFCTPSHYSVASNRVAAADICPAQEILDFAIGELEREIKDQQRLVDNHKGNHKKIHKNISQTLQYALDLLRGST